MGEAGFEIDTGKSKHGNNTSRWSVLPYDKGADHASDHATGGPDELTPDDIGAARIDPLTGKVDVSQLPDSVVSAASVIDSGTGKIDVSLLPDGVVVAGTPVSGGTY
jgi:hypothetical protein